MLVKHLCGIVLLVFVCVVSADQDAGLSGKAIIAEIQSEIINFVDNILHQTVGQCASDTDCHHLGNCETRDGGKFCSCKNGTSGDFCETVDECVDNPERCGTQDDVSCVFDVAQDKADCKCDNDSKKYVPDEEACMSPCTSYDQCGRYGYCYHEIGDQKFCACNLGTSGDYCEIIDDCHYKHVDCGVDNNATCTLGGKGKGYCKCADPQKGFDYDEKVCKDCDGCGEHARTGCVYRDGIRKCSCYARYFSSDKGVCEDCKCGANSYGCKFENGSKICQCWGGSEPNGDVCEKCDCGSDGAKCKFKDDKKVCTCKDGYIHDGWDGICTQMCNATHPCENGGKCVRNACSCLRGTSGNLCRTIDDCWGSRKCGNADCLFNATSQEAYCKCRNTRLSFDDQSKLCKVCDCGTYQRSCSFVEGKKKCNCMDVYEDKQGECTLCFCKGYSSMYGCHFDGWKMVCNCLKGYAQQGEECKTCDCGEYGKCSLYGWGSKICSCEEGYIESRGTCVECDCGEHGTCRIENGKKACSCMFGYIEYQGICTACNCGAHGECQINKYGKMECICNSGYAMKYRYCAECDCHPGTSCTFGGFNDDDKVCICPKKYADNKGSCTECNCQVEEANCTLSYEVMKCKCPSGYEEVRERYNFYKSSCKDIDECFQRRVCPFTTKCVNTPGSYDCVCEEGYEKPPGNADVKIFGCLDIDECVRDLSACTDPYARCVNTPGSYRCDCQLGYSVSKGYPEKNNICWQGSRPWRIATIVIGCLSAVVIIGLLIGIFNRHRS